MGDMKDLANQIIGQISNFTETIRGFDEDKITKEVELVFELGAKLKPLGSSEDLSHFFKQLKEYINNLI